MKTIPFTKVAMPYGWLGNMSPHPIKYDGKTWRTAEALFQALRFADEQDREAIRSQTSPMAAKLVAKRRKLNMAVIPGSDQDIENMRLVLRLKVEQHPSLRQQLIETGDAEIVEDCTNRRASIWGAKYCQGRWDGRNLLGLLWMELRNELA